MSGNSFRGGVEAKVKIKPEEGQLEEEDMIKQTWAGSLFEKQRRDGVIQMDVV